MITQKRQNIGGLIIGNKRRKAGQMEKDGKLIEWGERETITILLFEGENERSIRKYCLSPSYEKKILQGLDILHWGALIELEFDDRNEVISLTVVKDVLKDFYEHEIEL